MVLLLNALLAGCGGGGTVGGVDEISGGGVDTSSGGGGGSTPLAPTVTFTDPANSTNGVALNKKISATFSEGMDPLTLNTTTFTVTGHGVTPVSGTVIYAGPTATFTPTNALAASTLCSATISTVAKDLAGNALAANYTWSFTTGVAPDTTPPLVNATNPVAVASGICINKTVNATFSEPMDPLTITNVTFTLMDSLNAPVTGGVAYDALTNIATFTPVVNLNATTVYTATIKNGTGGVKGGQLCDDL